MDYALLGLGIAIIAALGWVGMALYDLKDRAVAQTDHLLSLQRQIKALPPPQAPDLSELVDINRRLALLLALARASFQHQPEPTPELEAMPAPERIAQRVESAKQGRELLRQRLAQRSA